MPTVKVRKRDKRTVARIARESKQRATDASQIAQQKRAKARLRFLSPLGAMRVAGLSPYAMAREFEHRKILTLTGKRYWDQRSVQNLLDYFKPFFDWFEMPGSVDSYESKKFYEFNVRKLLGGKSIGDYLDMARRGEEIVVVPPRHDGRTEEAATDDLLESPWRKLIYKN